MSDLTPAQQAWRDLELPEPFLSTSDAFIAGYNAAAHALQAAGKIMADALHGNVAECGECGLAHAHLPDCPIAIWLVAGGTTMFRKEEPT